jgi:opacity protein-like surface antigen
LYAQRVLNFPAVIGNDSITTRVRRNDLRANPETGKYNLAAVYYFSRQGNAPDLHAAPTHVGGHFYAGLNGSYEEAYSHSDYFYTGNTTRTQGVITADNYSSIAGLMKIRGWNVGLLAGYGMNFSNRWYAGVEVFGNWDEVDGRFSIEDAPIITLDGTVIASSATYTHSRFEKEWDMGAAFIPGYQVSNNALLYARIGYVGAEFEISNSRSAIDTGFTEAQNAARYSSGSKWLSGLQLGVGVDTVVYENFSLRSEFNVNNYGNYNRTSLSMLTNGTTTTYTTRHRHNIEDQFNVALIWHFFD